jgi:hypothetical protein
MPRLRGSISLRRFSCCSGVAGVGSVVVLAETMQRSLVLTLVLASTLTLDCESNGAK